MRLINVKSVCVEEFNESDIPPYAILSHTWGAEEVTLQDMHAALTSRPSWKSGYNKIVGTCNQAQQDGIEYAWVDTCCIDKTSSAELSEAINSMFRWYKEAKVCYAYLSDIVDTDRESIVESRWLTRGWTLQELIAPRYLFFYTANWETIGTRQEVAESISAVTGIDCTLLAEEGDDRDTVSKLKSFSVAERMYWASKRQTTRTEDQAYCLLGIFDINMPLLYGEGTKAFIRLQEEIIRQVDDISIFAWNIERQCHHGPGIFWNSDTDSRPNSKPRARTMLNPLGRMALSSSNDSGQKRLYSWSVSGQSALSIRDGSAQIPMFSLDGSGTGVLAVAPCCFSESADIITVGTQEQYSPPLITNRGIRLNLRVWKNPDSGRVEYAVLYCRRRSGHATSLLALPLLELPGNRFQRAGVRWTIRRSEPELERAPIDPIYFVVRPAPSKFEIPAYSVIINTLPRSLIIERVSDTWEWNAGTRLIVPRHRRYWAGPSQLEVTLRRIQPGTSLQPDVPRKIARSGKTPGGPPRKAAQGNATGSIKVGLGMVHFGIFQHVVPPPPIIRCEVREGDKSSVVWIPWTAVGRFMWLVKILFSSFKFTQSLSLEVTLAERTFLGRQLLFLDVIDLVDISANIGPANTSKRIPLGFWFAAFVGPMFVLRAGGLLHPVSDAERFVESAVYALAITLMILFLRG